MKQNLRLGTISGIPVGINWGLLLIAGFYTYVLATELLPDANPGSGTGMYWLAALGGVILLFFSILVHELAHSLVAQRNGITVAGITLWLLGGVAELKGEAKTAGVEFRIAAAGPASNVVLGGLFLGLAALLEATNGASLTASTLLWLAVINGALAVFNLIPASPLDGGRILAAILWKLRNDKQSGRRVAALSGAFFGNVLLFTGILMMLQGGGGIWFAVMGWFLRAASKQELKRSELFAAAEGRTAVQAMAVLERPVHGAVTAAGLATMAGEIEHPVAFPVRAENGRPLGLVPSSLLAAAVRRAPDMRVDELAIGWEKFVTAWDHEPLSGVLDRFTESGCTHALVYDAAGDQVGYIGVDDVQRSATPKPTPVPEPA